jgi:hypothetical protein
MKTLALALTAAGLMAACAPMDDTGGATPEEGASQCKADQYQRFVGRNRSELPAAPTGATWRVTCTTFPMTMDFNPERMNVLFNQQTNIIEQVRCG